MQITQCAMQGPALDAAAVSSLAALDPHLVLVFASLNAMQTLDAAQAQALLRVISRCPAPLAQGRQ